MNEIQFGQKVKQRREKIGLSQKDLARALDMDQGKVSLIERGARKVDSATELPLLAKVLKIPISWFFEGEPELTQGEEPIRTLLKEYFPKTEFTDLDVQKMKKIFRSVASQVVDSYISEQEVI